MTATGKYRLSLRERAVRLYRTSHPEPQIKRMALGLGVRPEALRSWIRQAETDAGGRDDRLTTAACEELAVLQKENAQLRRANDGLGQHRRIFAAQRGGHDHPLRLPSPAVLPRVQARRGFARLHLSQGMNQRPTASYEGGRPAAPLGRQHAWRCALRGEAVTVCARMTASRASVSAGAKARW